MLVLTIKEGQGLYIGDEVHIQFSSLKESNVKVAIDAPQDVLVLRAELVGEAETMIKKSFTNNIA